MKLASVQYRKTGSLQNTLAYFVAASKMPFSLPVPAMVAGLEPLTLRMMRQVFYHCSTSAGQVSVSLRDEEK